MKINSIIDLVKDLDTSRQTKNLNKLLIRILLHLQVEFSNYFYVRQGGDTWIRRREGRDIWRNLYELPLIETDEEQGLDDLQRSGIWAELFHDAGQVGVSSQVYSCKHVLSHRIIHARFYMVETEFAPDMTGYMKIPVERLGDYAVSRLTEGFLEKLSMNYPSLF